MTAVDVLSPKVLPTVTAPNPGRHSNMPGKETRRSEGWTRGSPHHHSPSRPSRSGQQKQQQEQLLYEVQKDISENFDPSHIVYDSGTDTTYLRGRLLGKGGFARCYELLCLSNNKIYAGKIISKTRISKPNQKEKILREVDLQRDLKHRNVVEFHSYFEDNDNVYIILENCSRKSLMHVMKHRKTLTEPEVRYYIHQMLCGVQYVHSRRIVHRDLKLGNMLLNDDMHLKLADFGLATRLDFMRERKNTVCGTPNYIAPEVLKKRGHGFEADIWAVGCTMYAMLVGRPPFETHSLTETYKRITENTYTMPPYVSPPAAALIRKCLVADPHRRPTLQSVMADEFFTCGYMPRSLSPSCCTSVPSFPAAHGSKQDTRLFTLLPPPEAGPDPMGQLGNDLSRVQLNSCSENLLEEKELQTIEKQPAQPTSPKKWVSVSPSPQVSVKDTVADNKQNRSHSPTVKEVAQTQGLAVRLLEALSACMLRMPKDGHGKAPELCDQNTVWVTKWVDYSNKYGFGFRLSSDAVGVLFNDTSRMLLQPDGRSVEYHDMTGKLSTYTLDSAPDEVERKTTLLQYFARYMDEHLIQGGDLESSSDSTKAPGSSLYLKKWFRTTKAIVMYLSDGTLQVNFFEDHAKLILSSVKGEYTVTFIDPERCAHTYSMPNIRTNGCQPDLRERLAFAHTMLQNLVEIEGDDI